MENPGYNHAIVPHLTDRVVAVGRSRAKVVVNIIAGYVIVTSLVGLYVLGLQDPESFENEVFSGAINFYIVAVVLTAVRLILGITLVVGNIKGITWIMYTWMGMIGFELVAFIVFIISRQSESEGSQPRFLRLIVLALWVVYAIFMLYQRIVEVKFEHRMKSYILASAIQQLLRNRSDDEEPPQYETVVEADTQNLLGQQQIN